MDGSGSRSSLTPESAVVPRTKMTRTSCDLCKRMKIKCERHENSCKHCATRNLNCTFSARERKRRIVKRTDYIAAIEDRIQRMEAMMAAAGLTAEPSAAPQRVEDEIGEQAGLSDRMSNLMVGEKRSPRFVGASSAFSLFSPHGLQWTKDRTRGYDTDRLFRVIAEEGHQPSCDFTKHLWRSRSDEEQEPLPSRQVADEYINAYFHHFNLIFPIYDEARFRVLYERQYSLNPPLSTAWYASLNVVLAMGSAIWHESYINGQRRSIIELDLSQNVVSWLYFRNASSKFTDLLFEADDIMAIQAILCMAFMLQVTPDPQPAYILAAAAVRMSHTLGLHRSLDEFGLGAAEKKLRQNVFWVTYVTEVGMSFRCGRPPAMGDQDIAVALPQTTSTGFDHFLSIATLSLLENRVYLELYSAKATTRSRLERLKSIGKLDAELTRWRDALPLGYRPESEICCQQHELTPVVMMHFSYYNCLSAIHRASIHHALNTVAPDSEASVEDLDGEIPNPRVYSSSSLRVDAARNIVGLLKHYNRDFPKDSLITMAMYYPLSAAMTLFANILENPGSAEAFSDIDLMGDATAFLNRSIQFQQQPTGILRILTELNHIAGLVVRDAQLEKLNELKKQTEETADVDHPHVSYTYLQGEPTQSLMSSDGSDDTIPPATPDPYADLSLFDPSQMFSTSEPFAYFSGGLTDTWTEPLSENLASERHMNW